MLSLDIFYYHNFNNPIKLIHSLLFYIHSFCKIFQNIFNSVSYWKKYMKLGLLLDLYNFCQKICFCNFLNLFFHKSFTIYFTSVLINPNFLFYICTHTQRHTQGDAEKFLPKSNQITKHQILVRRCFLNKLKPFQQLLILQLYMLFFMYSITL